MSLGLKGRFQVWLLVFRADRREVKGITRLPTLAVPVLLGLAFPRLSRLSFGVGNR